MPIFEKHHFARKNTCGILMGIIKISKNTTFKGGILKNTTFESGHYEKHHFQGWHYKKHHFRGWAL
jgi:hypothetical protein